MSRYRSRETVTAVWWLKNGDHPQDGTGAEGAVVRYFRHPGLPGDQVHTTCGHAWDDHGWIDNDNEGPGDNIVCPGSWVIEGAYYFTSMSPAEFDDHYELIDEEN